MPNTSDNNQEKIEIGFVDRLAPPLTAGVYQVQVTSRFEKNRPGGVPEMLGMSEEWLHVGGKRFGFDAGDIDSVYPPQNGQGEYATALPHIVFHRKGLPWERKVGPERDARPWLALLLFDQDDPAPRIQTVPIGALTQAATPSGVFFPGVELEPDEDPTMACSVIDVPKALFNEIKPTWKDLPLQAHSRVVDMKHKAVAEINAFLQIENPSEEEAQSLCRSKRVELEYTAQAVSRVLKTYSVLIGSRLPQADKESIVHLVSLENYSEVLQDNWENPNIHSVRLISLKNWRFSSINTGGSFLQHFRNLNGETIGNATSEDHTFRPDNPILLHFPFTPNPGILKKSFSLLQQGFVPMEHRFRQAIKSVSWYRGPLVPLNLPAILPLPASSADALLIYDPDTGYYDVSYAAAWQLGQLLALKNKAYSKALYFWKQRMGIQSRKLLERQILKESLPVVPASGSNFNATESALLPDFAVIGEQLDQVGTQKDGKEEQEVIQSQESLQDVLRQAVPTESTGPINRNDEDYRTIQTFLNRLRSTQGIPYNYLVAHTEMLPPESIRFFLLDPNWINALVDGACSIGDFLPQEESLKRTLKPNAGETSGTVYSGFLLRSSMISIWPGVEVRVQGMGSGELLPVRFERLAEDMIICIVPQIISSVEFRQPPEGLHFGIKEATDQNTGKVLFKKSLQDGTVIQGETNTKNRINLSDLASEANITGETDSAKFAFKMVQNPFTVRLELKPGTQWIRNMMQY
jgi:hypothetical protein